MFHFLAHQIVFWLTIFILFFLPGFFFLRWIFTEEKSFTLLEKLVLSLALSFVIVNFLLLTVNFLGLPINRASILTSIALFCFVCAGTKKFLSRKNPIVKKEKTSDLNDSNSMIFSPKQNILIVLILFLTILTKTIYLSKTIFPSSTDLGHHMYWSKLIADTGKIPVYQKRDIIEKKGIYKMSEPRPIDDFIVGEHLIFSATALVANKNFISAFPSLLLLLINIFSLLAVFILAFRLAASHPAGKIFALLCFFFIAPLYSLSAPQAKFVSGGVIGNLIGNLLIPIILYFFYRAFSENNARMMAAAFLVLGGIFYTHHLSSLILLFVFFFSLLFFIILGRLQSLNQLKKWLRLVVQPINLIVLALLFFFVFFVHTPAYFDTESVKTATGSPVKSTRTGLTLEQFKYSVGESRLALGVTGLFLLIFVPKKFLLSKSLIAGWAVSLLILSLAPKWLFIDLPSNRVANYASLPLSLLSACALFFLYIYVYRRFQGSVYKFWPAVFLICLAFASASGFYDNAQLATTKNNFSSALQTFKAAHYLAQETDQSDTIIKDHNYLTADAWMKLFFMRDYNFPLSRSYFKRYEDSFKPREKCTFWMISAPTFPEGEKCYQDLGVNFFVVNYLFDSAPFRKATHFSQVYQGENIVIYYRPKKT